MSAAIVRKKGLKRGGFTKPTAKTIQKMRDWRARSRVALKPGKKTKAWNATRAGLKQRFARAGITSCELRYAGCWGDNGLGFAHSKRRRNITGEELSEVILSCNACHDALDLNPEAVVTDIVKKIIANRIRLL